MMTGAVMTYWLDNSQTYQCSWLLSWGVFAAKSQMGNCEKQTTERVCARVHLQYINPHIFFSCFFFPFLPLTLYKPHCTFLNIQGKVEMMPLKSWGCFRLNSSATYIKNKLK